MFLEMTDEEYFAYDALNSTQLKNLYSKTPRQYLFDKEQGFEPTVSMIEGSVLHCMMLEPDEYTTRYIEEPKQLTYEKPESRKKGARMITVTEDVNRQSSKHRELLMQFTLRNKGKTVITPAIADKCNAAHDYLVTGPHAEIFNNPEYLKEKVLTAELELDGQKRLYKAKYDIIAEFDDRVEIYDLKKVSDIPSPENWRGVVSKYDYDIQAYVYSLIASKAFPDKQIKFYHVPVYIEGQITACMYRMTEQWLFNGAAKVQNALEKLAEIEIGIVGGYLAEERSEDVLPPRQWEIKYGEDVQGDSEADS